MYVGHRFFAAPFAAGFFALGFDAGFFALALLAGCFALGLRALVRVLAALRALGASSLTAGLVGAKLGSP
jgi:hypothetical protein